MPKNFMTHLPAEITRISRRERLSPDKAFLFWFAVNILELSEEEARDAMAVEGANDKGIDLFFVDEEEGRILLMQGKYSPGMRYRPKLGELTKLESSLNWLANPEALRKDGKADLADAAEDYVRSVNDGYGVEMSFVYAGPKCANVDKHIAVYNQNPENVAKRKAIRHYHIDIISSAWNEAQGGQQRIPSEKITIVGQGVLVANGQFGDAVVATVPASELVRLHRKYEDRLFDRNVRLFLGVRKGSVNAGLAETLNDTNQRGNFWAFNNGITIICDSCIRRGSSIQLTNFSIVNGCQTVVSISQNLQADAAGVEVLTRCVAASPDIVDDVIRFNNSQNPIRTWDIASQDKTQRRLKTEFEHLSEPYIYMTRRGARPKGNLQKYRDDGRLRQIRIDLMGQYAAAFRGDPVLAYKHKAFIFSRYHDDMFPSDVRVQDVLFQWVCGETCREVVGKTIGTGEEAEVRILKKGGTLFVLAIMASILVRRNGATYLNGALERNIISHTTKGRLSKYAEYARDTYVQAVLDEADIEGQELPTLIRQREFFKKVKERVGRGYERDARADRWLKEAIPKLAVSAI